jgi:hypothetical protein
MMLDLKYQTIVAVFVKIVENLSVCCHHRGQDDIVERAGSLSDMVIVFSIFTRHYSRENLVTSPSNKRTIQPKARGHGRPMNTSGPTIAVQGSRHVVFEW